MSSVEQKDRKFGVKQYIPIAMIGISIAFIWLGFAKYGFWEDMKGPRPGFFPVIISFALMVAGLLALVFSFKEKAPSWPLENWLVPLSVVVIMGTTFIIGLLPSVGLYVLIWLRWFEKCTWKTTLTVFLIIMGIVIGAFVLWLGVPFPKGLILNLIAN